MFYAGHLHSLKIISTENIWNLLESVCVSSSCGAHTFKEDQKQSQKLQNKLPLTYVGVIKFASILCGITNELQPSHLKATSKKLFQRSDGSG